jgi:hypothetical protein
MRSPVWRAACALAVVVAALTVSGCDTDDPTDPPTPRPTSTPLFDSDEEALAAAEEAYGRYQAVEDLIFSEGGVGAERIEEVAVREALQAARDGFAEVALNGEKGIGHTKYDSFELQQMSTSTESEEDVVVVYVCLDFSESDVVDRNNVSIVNPNRLVRQTFELSFDSIDSARELVLASREPWGGADKCSG